MATPSLSTGEVAAMTGRRPSSIRYYERLRAVASRKLPEITALIERSLLR
jgi:DNA-binding transcriptional MerR regulator